MKKSNILVHIPHSSLEIPFEYQDLFELSPLELTKEQLKMVDLYTNYLFDLPAEKLVFPISRLICDVERFRDEKKEIMTKNGMWVCYTNTSDLKILKNISEEHKQEILKKYYDPHHLKLEKIIERMLKKYGKCLIIDGHSFSSIPQKYELFGDSARPDICIGIDDYHTPQKLHSIIASYFLDFGYHIGINVPFKGSIVPQKYFHKNANVNSIMIEINRSLYIDEETGIKNKKYYKLKDDIQEIYNEIEKLYS